MSDIPIGGLGGGEAGGPNDETLYLSVHGFDNVDGFDVDYDEIRYQENNRWHMQSHFDILPDSDPNNDGIVDFSYEPLSVNYYIETGGGYLTDFANAEPTESQMANNDANRFPVSDLFTVIASAYPYLAGAGALINMAYSSSGSLTEDPYDSLDWYIPLNSTDMNMPDDQDSAAGARFDLNNQGDSNDPAQQLTAESEMSYRRIDGYGYDNFSTQKATATAEYTPID
jgi:hypothetical protein